MVGQASDEASSSVGQAGAGNHDDRSNARARPKKRSANETFGSVESPVPTLAAITEMTAEVDGIPVGCVSGDAPTVLDRGRSVRNRCPQGKTTVQVNDPSRMCDSRGVHGVNA